MSTQYPAVIRIRMQADSLIAAQAKADACHLSLSAYVRSAIDGTPMPGHLNEDDAAELINLYGLLLRESRSAGITVDVQQRLTGYAHRVLAVAKHIHGGGQ